MIIDEQAIFAAALEIECQADRAKYLTAACGESECLRTKIEQLITAHFREDGLLDGTTGIDTQPFVACTTLEPGTEVGQYTITEVLGEGGFGIVYRATQRKPLRRDVALKILKPDVDSQQIIKRFETELQLLGRMEHPHIAQVFEAGSTENGNPFFAMELVDGTPITTFCQHENLSIDQRLSLFLSVCRAIQHAHEKGVIHRDIKPSNVLVTQRDDVPFPKIIDFGIATFVAETVVMEAGESESGASHWVGTPAYMSPEEIRSGNEQVDVRTDVYGLGLLLYELLTDRNPHWDASQKSVTVEEVRQRILNESIVAPSQRTPTGRTLSADLDHIALKSLSRSPQDRYAGALALARDVERFREHRTVTAHPPSLTYPLRKFAKRNQMSLIMWSLTAAIIAVILIPTTLNHWKRTEDQRQQIVASLTNAEELHHQALVTGNTDLESISKAIAAARQAETLLASGSHEPAIHARVEGLLAKLLFEEEDRRFLSTIERAQIHFVQRDPIGRQRTRAKLYEAFEALDISVGSTPPDAAAAQIANRSLELQGFAIAALDIWSALYCQDAPQTADWIRKVVAIADQQPWRTQLRSALHEGNLGVLEQLAKSKDLNAQSPSSLILLVNALRASRNRYFIPTLQSAADAYPNVLYFNSALGSHYSRMASKHDTDANQKAIRYLSAALALRPNDHKILSNLSMNLSRAGNHSRAVSLLGRAVESREHFWIGWHNLGLAFARQGDFAAALDAHRTALFCIDRITNNQSVTQLLKRNVNGLKTSLRMVHGQPVFADPTWQITTDMPPHWPTQPDTSWRTASTSFGTPYFQAHTPWTDAELWLSKEFELDEPAQLFFAICAVAKVEIHVDDAPVLKRAFTRDDPKLVPISLDLEPGQHVVSVYLTATTKERCFEARLFRSDETTAEKDFRREIAAAIEHYANPQDRDPVLIDRRRKIVSVLETALSETD